MDSRLSPFLSQSAQSLRVLFKFIESLLKGSGQFEKCAEQGAHRPGLLWWLGSLPLVSCVILGPVI